MGLKFTVAKLDEVPETVRSMYKQEGTVYVLDVEGVVPKERIDEFRNNNIQLQQQLEKLKHIDPTKYAELIALDTQVKEGELIKAGKLEEVVNLRVGEMKRTYETEKVTLSTQLSTANSQLALLLIDNTVKNAAIKNGVVDTALDDLVLRARSTYTLDKGQPVPKNEKGEVIYGKDGTTPMSIDDWMTGLKKTAPHLFRGSSGSGANGGRNNGQVDMSKLTPSQKISMGIAQGGLVSKLPGES
jgi:hypothetical protein